MPLEEIIKKRISCVAASSFGSPVPELIIEHPMGKRWHPQVRTIQRKFKKELLTKMEAAYRKTTKNSSISQRWDYGPVTFLGPQE